MKYISLAVALAMPGCASVTIRGVPQVVQSKDGSTRLEAPVHYKASGIDRLPMQDFHATAGSVSIIEHMPENGNWPTERTMLVDKQGVVIGINEKPMYASNASNTTNTIHNVWSGVAKFAIGAITTMATTIGLANAAADTARAASSASTAKHAASTTAGTQQAKISADAATRALEIAR